MLNILDNQIENLKEQLNSMLATDGHAYNEILRVSQELDVLIVEFLSENKTGNFRKVK